MTFDFSELQTVNEYRQNRDMRLAGILDQLPEEAPEWQVWQAFAKECTDRISNYKTLRPMIRFWFSASKTMHEMAMAEPEMFLDVVNHLQAKLEELT